MAKTTAKEVLTGTNATVFFDGEEIATFTNIEATVTPNYEDVQIGFDVDRVAVSWTGEGTLTHQATNSISTKLFNKMKATKDLRVTIKAELNKPYTDKERMNFIVEQNHKKGYKIEETEKSIIAKGYTEEELALQEQERVAMLSLTAADVERGIYKATGKDFDDVVAYVETLITNNSVMLIQSEQLNYGETCEPVCASCVSETSQGQGNNTENKVTASDSVAVQLDLKALKIELKANNFYRGNPYVDTIGTLLGFTKTQLDEFFETGDYKKLINTVK